MSSEATPDTKIVGYCRSCGKALDETSVRSAHGTIFCEEHLPPSAVPPPFPGEGPAASASSTASNAGFGQAPFTASPYTAPPYSSGAAPQYPNGNVSPGLAFFLGLIPGVGAIYNGQYAKGLIHVFLLGLMITIISDNLAGGLEPMVGLLIAGFCVYMPFEAYHTAQKRRAGQAVDEFSGLARGQGGSNRFPVVPVVLIALGSLFLANNLGLFQIRQVLRYWPLLLIGTGVYLLWSRMSGPGSGNQQGPGTGGHA